MTSIKQIIIQHLEAEYRKSFAWGGVLARAIHDLTGTKEAIVERRCRELVKSGLLEAIYEKVNGEGHSCVRYRIAKILPQVALTEEVNQTNLKI